LTLLDVHVGVYYATLEYGNDAVYELLPRDLLGTARLLVKAKSLIGDDRHAPQLSLCCLNPFLRLRPIIAAFSEDGKGFLC
jgi:hypothetical protein